MKGLLWFLAGSNFGVAGLLYEQTGEIASNFYAGIFVLVSILCGEVMARWGK